MLFVFLTVSGVFFGSSVDAIEETCYGQGFRFPFGYAPPLYNGPLYFTPSTGGPRKVLMDKGQSKDPRLEISYTSLYLKDLTEEDDGYFSISFDGTTQYNIATLKILDCADEITKDYGSMYQYPVPQQAEFLQFTPRNRKDRSTILWNRTDPEIDSKSRGRVINKLWMISDLTQKDSGYYNFRQKNNHLTSRLLLKVQGHTRNMTTKVDNNLHIVYPWATGTWGVNFTRVGEREHVTMIAGGEVVKDHWFNGRIQAMTDGIKIDPVGSKDSGKFEFRDSQGNLALTVFVEVKHALAEFPYQYVAIAAVIIISVIICCCCYCCKKKRSKRDKSTTQTAAAPAVYYHDATQPTGPSYSAAPSSSAFYHQPVNSHVPQEVTAFSTELPVASPEGQEAAPPPYNSLGYVSSDAEPRFDLKGLMSPSALPLSSDSTFCAVYNSDKLNIL